MRMGVFGTHRGPAGSPGAQYPTESGRGGGTDLYRPVAVRSIVSSRPPRSTDHRRCIFVHIGVRPWTPQHHHAQGKTKLAREDRVAAGERYVVA